VGEHLAAIFGGCRTWLVPVHAQTHLANQRHGQVLRRLVGFTFEVLSFGGYWDV
jgi:hypothetical protein